MSADKKLAEVERRRNGSRVQKSSWSLPDIRRLPECDIEIPR
jgi:hypothetical protein